MAVRVPSLLLLLSCFLVVMLFMMLVGVRAKCGCGAVYSPVCGSDGNTYASQCALDCATAFKGVRIAHLGECGAPLTSPGGGQTYRYGLNIQGWIDCMNQTRNRHRTCARKCSSDDNGACMKSCVLELLKCGCQCKHYIVGTTLTPSTSWQPKSPDFNLMCPLLSHDNDFNNHLSHLLLECFNSNVSQVPSCFTFGLNPEDKIIECMMAYMSAACMCQEKVSTKPLPYLSLMAAAEPHCVDFDGWLRCKTSCYDASVYNMGGVCDDECRLAAALMLIDCTFRCRGCLPGGSLCPLEVRKQLEASALTACGAIVYVDDQVDEQAVMECYFGLMMDAESCARRVDARCVSMSMDALCKCKDTGNSPSMPSVTETTTSVSESTPSVPASTPSVPASTPSVPASTPSVPKSTPSIPTHQSSTPSVLQSTPSVTISTESECSSSHDPPQLYICSYFCMRDVLTCHKEFCDRRDINQTACMNTCNAFHTVQTYKCLCQCRQYVEEQMTTAAIFGANPWPNLLGFTILSKLTDVPPSPTEQPSTMDLTLTCLNMTVTDYGSCSRNCYGDNDYCKLACTASLLDGYCACTDEAGVKSGDPDVDSKV